MGYDMAVEVSALNEIFVEFYYWITVPLMFLIHVGFCLYEVSVSRAKNHMHTLMKNASGGYSHDVLIWILDLLWAAKVAVWGSCWRCNSFTMGYNYGVKLQGSHHGCILGSVPPVLVDCCFNCFWCCH